MAVVVGVSEANPSKFAGVEAGVGIVVHAPAEIVQMITANAQEEQFFICKEQKVGESVNQEG